MEKFKQFIRTTAGKCVAVASSALVTAPAFAADAIDVSGPTASIASGVIAAGLIGSAWVGFKYLQKVWRSM